MWQQVVRESSIGAKEIKRTVLAASSFIISVQWCVFACFFNASTPAKAVTGGTVFQVFHPSVCVIAQECLGGISSNCVQINTIMTYLIGWNDGMTTVFYPRGQRSTVSMGQLLLHQTLEDKVIWLMWVWLYASVRSISNQVVGVGFRGWFRNRKYVVNFGEQS